MPLHRQLKFKALSFVKGLDDIFMVASALTLVGLIPALFMRKTGKEPKEELSAGSTVENG